MRGHLYETGFARFNPRRSQTPAVKLGQQLFGGSVVFYGDEGGPMPLDLIRQSRNITAGAECDDTEPAVMKRLDNVKRVAAD